MEGKMKIAVSASGRDLESSIDPRFGRCAYFLIVETEDMGFEAFSNELMTLGGGAGIQSAQFVASKGAKAVITGNCGPNAVQTLQAAGVTLYVGQAGTVREGVEMFKRGALTPATGPNVADHYGMRESGQGPGSQARASGMGLAGGRGMGMGRGRGMGMGRGRGMGMCGGQGTGLGRDPWARSSGGQEDVLFSSQKPDLQKLQTKARSLASQLKEVQELIKKLEDGK